MSWRMILLSVVVLVLGGCSLLFGTADAPTDGGVPDATINQDLLLTTLTLSSGVELQPAFASSVFVYTANTTTLTQPIAVTATTDNANAEIFVDDVPVESGTASSPILLEPDVTEVYIDVRSGSESQRYTLRIDNQKSEQTAYVKASNTGTGDSFGSSVSIFGDTLVVGAPNEDSAAVGINVSSSDLLAESGAVYVYGRSSSGWAHQTYIKASNTGASDEFGASVAVFGDTLVVGAPGESSDGAGVGGAPGNDNSSGSGAVYVFRRTGTTWAQEAYIKAASPGEGDGFGASVAIDEDTLVVGATLEDGNATGINGTPNDMSTDSGAVYVFHRSGSTWSQQAYVKASNTDADDRFGGHLALSGDTLAVGAIHESSSAQGQSNNDATHSGAVYVFQRSDSTSTWSQQAYLKAHNTSAADVFGASVALSADTLVVGATFEDGDEQENASGSAYVFRRTGDTWEQEQYLRASNPDENDSFGVAVAVSQDVLVIGTHLEDSNTLTGNDNSLASSGAAYVFRRSDSGWSQRQFLKATNREASDFFGRCMALSQGILAICAGGEDSNSINVNGIDNNAANDSGAVYLFQ